MICSDEQGTTTICGYRIGAGCLARIRVIAADAAVVVDEQLLGGELRKFSKRALTRAERHLEDNQERRAIAAARRSA